MDRPPPNRRGTVLFASAVVGLAGLVWLAVVRAELLVEPTVDHSAATGLAALAFIGATLQPIRYQRRDGQTRDLSPTSLVLVVALSTIGGPATITARILASVIVNLAKRRMAVKAAVNVAAATAEVVGAAAFHLACRALLGEHAEVVGVVGAALVGDASTFVVVTVAIAIYTRAPRTIDPTAPFDSLVAVGYGTLGAVGLVVYRTEPVALVLVGVIPLLLFAGHRDRVALEVQLHRLRLLHELTTSLASVSDDRELPVALNRSACSAVGGHESWLLSRGDRERVIVTSDGRAPDEAVRDALLGIDAAGGASVRIVPADPTRPDAVASDLLVGTVDAVGDRQVTLIVRARDGAAWTDDHVETFEVVVSQAAVALRVGDLAERLASEVASRAAVRATDRLTGVPNRFGFLAAVSDALADDGHLAVALIDLRGFARVNDGLGPACGDLVLVRTAQRLGTVTQPHHHLSRVSGDVFAVCAPPGEIDGLVSRVLWRLSHEPYVLEGLSLTLAAAVGVASAPEDADGAEQLLRCADRALRQAKTLTLDVVHHREVGDASSRRGLRLGSDLRRAIADDGLHLEWQPQVDLGSGRIVGAEALCRWNHDELGRIPPPEFVEAAEETGAIGELSLWVIGRALRELADLRAEGIEVRGSINLSIHNLLSEDFTENVADLLASHDVDPGQVRFEVTETVAMVDPERTRACIRELIALGSSISIDDFGTGYSSLAYLQDLHASEVKIDRTFTSRAQCEHDARAIAGAIIRLSQELGLETVAEGIEDDETAELFASLGCDLGQGYLWSRPVPLAEFRALWRARNRTVIG